jgi:hypothetical protein
MTTSAEVGQSNAAWTQLASNIAVDKATAGDVPRWGLDLRVAFRLSFIYFCLFAVSNHVLGGLFIIPGVRIPALGVLWPLRQITFWTARHVFGITHQLIYEHTGSSDKTFDWVQVFCLMVFAVIATAVWSAIDRQHRNYLVIHKWFRVFVRFALASEMFIYGFDKVIPVQMSSPFLTVLVEPYGNFSPMASLWYSIGASHAYEIFVGSAEVLGGLLLIFPRTVTFGALVCLGELAQVFALNMTYDVPVKLMALHLILFAVFLLAPDFRRLINFFFFESSTDAPVSSPLLRKPDQSRLAKSACRSLLAFYLMAINVSGAIQSWRSIGDGQPKPTLYGIWDVEQMTIDGHTRLPLLTDHDRWRRVIFDFTTRTSFQRMDDSFVVFGSSISETEKTIILIDSGDKNWKSTLAYARPAPDRLLVDGLMNKHTVHMQLKLLDRNKFNLINRGFHWINEYPFQR